MNEPNPYEYRHADVGASVDEEMFDHEARLRIAESLHASHFPMTCFAIFLMLVGLCLTAFALFLVLVAAREFFRYSVLRGFVQIGFMLTFAIGTLCAANWLWSCAVTIDRARKRLTIASVATAVQAQSEFWRKTGKLLLICTILFATAAVLMTFTAGR